MLFLAVFSVYVGTQLESIVAVAKFLAVMTSGAAFLSVARWYWWRIGVWSEIASICSSLIIGISLFWLVPDDSNADRFALRLAINMSVTAFVVIAVTYLKSQHGPSPQAIRFYERLRVSGWGWRRVQMITGLQAQSGDLLNATVGWLSSIVFLYALLFGVGHALFANWWGVAIAGFFGILGIAGIRYSLPNALREISEMRSDDSNVTSKRTDKY